MFCGFRTAQPFASCGHLKNCFANFTSLDGFDECLEFDVHANLHAMHAGMWDCSVDVSQVRPARPRACDARARSSARRALFPPTQWIATMGPSISTDLMSFVVLTLPTLLADRESNFPWLFCPTSCALNATACRCTSSIGNLDRMSDNEVYKNLYNALQYMQNGAYLGDVRRRRARGRRAPALLLARALIRGRPPPRGSATSKSSMTGRSSSARRRARSRRATTRNSNGSCSRSEQRARTRARARAARAARAARSRVFSRAQIVADPGVTGPMGMGAATLDPVFWPMHGMFEKAWQVLRLSEQFASFNLTWNNQGASPSCKGVGWHEATPFARGLFGEDLGPGGAHGGAYYTNAELWKLFDPHKDDVPYVYDNFTAWGECDWDPLAPAQPSESEVPPLQTNITAGTLPIEANVSVGDVPPLANLTMT